MGVTQNTNGGPVSDDELEGMAEAAWETFVVVDNMQEACIGG
jgi:hypothetical protein